VVGEVLWVDRYGNCQLNVDPADIAEFGDPVTLRLPGDQVRTAHRVTTFGELGPGQVGLVVDSYGLVALVTDRSSAAETMRLHPGSGVRLEPTGG
jgi:hypothetical protein